MRGEDKREKRVEKRRIDGGRCGRGFKEEGKERKEITRGKTGKKGEEKRERGRVGK